MRDPAVIHKFLVTRHRCFVARHIYKSLTQSRRMDLTSFSPYYVTLAMYFSLLPCLQTIRVSDRDSRTVIGRTRHVSSPVWSRIDWPTGPTIRIAGLSFAELEMGKTVHLELNINFNRTCQFYDSW